MTREEAILRYKTAMSVFKNWLNKGVINEKDLLVIGTVIVRKYGLSSGSIYLADCPKTREKKQVTCADML